MAALLLANPWVVESDSALPPPSPIRRRSWTRRRNPRKMWELTTGRINGTKIWQGLKAAQGGGLESARAKDMARALSDTRRPVTCILAERDNTAVSFEDAWNRPAFQHLRESERVRLVIIHTSSISFHRDDDAEALYLQVRNVSPRVDLACVGGLQA